MTADEGRLFGEAARRGDDPDQIRSGGAFNLHARQAVPAGDRAGLERLARYILRPPLSSARLERRAETLGLEVVTVREFLSALEGHYGLSIAEEDLPRITSLDRLVRYLELKSN